MNGSFRWQPVSERAFVAPDFDYVFVIPQLFVDMSMAGVSPPFFIKTM